MCATMLEPYHTKKDTKWIENRIEMSVLDPFAVVTQRDDGDDFSFSQSIPCSASGVNEILFERYFGSFQ